MKIKYRLLASDFKNINKVKQETSSFIEDKYWELYLKGNNFSLGEWRFYPVKDADNFKETAMSIDEINKRSKSDYYIIAQNEKDSFLGYLRSTDNTDTNIYCWNEIEDVTPVRMFKSIEEMILIFSSLTEGETFSNCIHLQIEKFLNCDKLFYLENPYSEYFAGNYSVNEFPSITFQFWSSYDKAKNYREGNWKDYAVKSLDINEFLNEYLEEFLADDSLIGFDWNKEFEDEIFPEIIDELL